MLHLTRSLSTTLVILSTIGIAHAGPNLVQNGGFEQTSFTSSNQMNALNVPNWATGDAGFANGYSFVFFAGTADTTGAYSPEYGSTYLWGPNDGSANGLPASSPAGGKFVAADGAYQVGAITQTINGLTSGHRYDLSFYWAGAQQSGYNGATTEQWDVKLGGQEFFTTVAPNANHGFTGWMTQVFTYTATTSSEVLSFLAVGTPGGQPPFVLLDGVSLVDDAPSSVPEPASLLVVAGAALAVAAIARSRSRLTPRHRRATA